MELIAKISKGSKMDQIYIPKTRPDFPIGQYVLIKPLKEQSIKINANPFFYNIPSIEPVKLKIVEEIFKLIEKNIKSENIIITGSFLESGFKFNDIDILIITEAENSTVKNIIESKTRIKTHIIMLTNSELIKGLSTDPLYQNMLSKCISRNRLIYKFKNKIIPKLLDFQLLKSKSLIDNFEILTGKEKYYLAMNLIAIILFLKNKKINQQAIDKKIKELFKVEKEKIKENLIDKSFIKKFKQAHHKTFDLIWKNAKQK